MNRALVFQGPDISTGEWINKWKEDNTDAVAKWKPEKIQACQNSNPNLCYNGAVLHPIGHFRYIKIQHDIEFDRTRTKKSLAIVLNFIYRKWPIEQARQLGDGHLPGSSRLVCFSPVFFVGVFGGLYFHWKLISPDNPENWEIILQEFQLCSGTRFSYDSSACLSESCSFEYGLINLTPLPGEVRRYDRFVYNGLNWWSHKWYKGLSLIRAVTSVKCLWLG